MREEKYKDLSERGRNWHAVFRKLLQKPRARGYGRSKVSVAIARCRKLHYLRKLWDILKPSVVLAFNYEIADCIGRENRQWPALPRIFMSIPHFRIQFAYYIRFRRLYLFLYIFLLIFLEITLLKNILHVESKIINLRNVFYYDRNLNGSRFK